MISKTYIKNVRITPKKLRFLLRAIKKLSPAKSLDYLFYTNGKGARVFYQAIKSALSNAKDSLKVSEDMLKFRVLLVEEGRKLRRFRAGSKGSSKPILKRMSHIKIVLEAKKKPLVKKITGKTTAKIKNKVVSRKKKTSLK